MHLCLFMLAAFGALTTTTTAATFGGATGAFVACVQRKRWSSLPHSAKMNFISAVKRAKASGAYDELGKIHNELANTEIHKGEQFLLWHRGYLQQAEQLFGVPIPYWDAAADSQAPHLSDIFSPQYLGGAGDASTDFCVSDGEFTMSKGWEAKVGHRGCLKRCFNNGLSINPYTSPEVDAAYISSSRTYTKFQKAIHYLHANVHLSLGITCKGDMSNLGHSPNDPVFWLHHANIDRLFARWQASCAAYGKLASYPENLNAMMNRLPYRYGDAILGGKLCADYERSPIDFPINPSCPQDPESAPTATAISLHKSTSTASSMETGPAKSTSTKPSLEDWMGANLDDADDGWLINVIKSLSEPASALSKRGGVFSSSMNATLAYNSYDNKLALANTSLTSNSSNEFMEAPVEYLFAPEVFDHIFDVNSSSYGLNSTLSCINNSSYHNNDSNCTLATYNATTIFEHNITDLLEYKPAPEILFPAPAIGDYTDKIHLRHPARMSKDAITKMGMDYAATRKFENYIYGVIDSYNNLAGFVSESALMKRKARFGNAAQSKRKCAARKTENQQPVSYYY